jgi:hypothetical protein
LKFTLGEKLLLVGGSIAALAAVWHLLCILGGPSWFAFARAPQDIIDSSIQGTLLAPIGTIVVAGLMFSCTFYAYSGAGIIRKVALLKPALMTIALLCLLRGLIAIPSFFLLEHLDKWQLIASSTWLFVGVCFLAGSIEQFRNKDLLLKIKNKK